MNKEKNKLKKIILYFTIVIFGLYLFYYLFFYGFSYPPCAEREIQSIVPDFLKDSEIIFEYPTSYYIRPKNDVKGIYKGMFCADTNKISKGYIDTDFNQSYIANYLRSFRDYTVTSVPEKIKFKVIKRVLIRCYLLACEDRGAPAGGDIFLLQDDNGDLWTIKTNNFVRPYYDNIKKLNMIGYNAGYYKNEVRLGDVKVEVMYN